MDKETISHIKENIQILLNDRFDVKNKKSVIEYSDRLNFACPYCGDSTDSRKKRGNIYLHNLTFHCFNCGHHCDYIKLMHDFDIPLGDTNLDVIADTVKSGKKKKKSSFDLEIFDELERLAFTRQDIKTKFHLVEIPPYGEIYDYLCKRCLKNKTDNFLYNKYHNELWILNMTTTGKIIGVQIRSFDESKVKYRTYNICKIYQYSGIEFPEKDEEIVEILNQTSITFNIMTVNLFDILYVFEGGIDAMFLPNSVGICGVGRNFDLVENLPETRYFFDNDKAGLKRTRDKLETGKSVFMWKKFLEDLNITEKIKDFNDLIIYMVKNKIRYDFNQIADYFTNEKLDLLEI